MCIERRNMIGKLKREKLLAGLCGKGISLFLFSLVLSAVIAGVIIPGTGVKADNSYDVRDIVAINADNFPDDIFRNYVSENFDSDGDGYLSQGEIAGVTYIDISYSDCESLKGIEFLSSLENLFCSSNKITTLDISRNIKLTYLDCSWNQITTLDISSNSELTYLNCYGNQMITLDLSACSELRELYCGNNQITTLDISECSELTQLYCGTNQLEALDITGCPKLTGLGCGDNQITALDISACSELTQLYCGTNRLKALDITVCPKLTGLGCEGNQITTLDISRCSELKELICGTNRLEALDITGCPKLTYLGCGDNQITALDITACPELTTLYCNWNQITTLDLTSCTKLERLECSNNAIESLDLTSCPLLTSVSCEFNKLQSLDLSSCTSLTWLACGCNQLMSLDVSSCPELTTLYCGENNLTKLDLEACSSLRALSCGDNNLTNLELEKIKDLESLWCSNNQLTRLELIDFASLSYLDCADNPLEMVMCINCPVLTYNNNKLSTQRLVIKDCASLAEINIFYGSIDDIEICDCNSLTFFRCSYIGVKNLNICNCENLAEIDCEPNKITSIEIDNCPALKKLNCQNNVIEKLDLKGSTALKEVYCQDNVISNIDLSGCISLSTLVCRNNRLSIMDISQCKALVYADISKNNLTGLDLENNTELNNLYIRENNIHTLDISNCRYLCDVTEHETSTPGYYYYNGYCLDVDPDVRIITEPVQLSIEQQPSDMITVEGGMVRFKVIALGSGLKYQWQISSDGGKNWIECDMEGNDTFELWVDADITMAGKMFRCIVGDKVGATLTSGEATLKITSDIDDLDVVISTINFPDGIFRKYICKQFDKDCNGILTSEEILEAKTVDVDKTRCSSLEGIKYLRELESISCKDNMLTDLDVRRCVKLKSLNCSGNQLMTLYLNESLESLYCSDNRLTDLDLGYSKLISYIDCSNNNLTALDVSDCGCLEDLSCNDNQLISLDITGCYKLIELECFNNKLTNINLYDNKGLRELKIQDNSLLRLDISNNPNLKEMYDKGYKYPGHCELEFATVYTPFGWAMKLCFLIYDPEVNIISEYTEPIIAEQPSDIFAPVGVVAKFRIRVGGNDMNYKWEVSTDRGTSWTDSIDEGFNTDTLFVEVKEEKNGYLYRCVVSDKYGITVVSDTASLMVASAGDENEVPINEENFPDNILRQYVSKNFDNDGNGMLSETEVNSVRHIKLNGTECKSLEGIGFFTELSSLDCKGNKLTELDINQFKSLVKLECGNNQLKQIAISEMPLLSSFGCNGNPLESLIIDGCDSLSGFNCSETDILSIEIKNCKIFEELLFDKSHVSVLKVNGCPILQDLNCQDIGLTQLWVTNCNSLKNVGCSNNAINILEIINCSDLRMLSCSYNEIESISVKDFIKLEFLGCSNNKLTTLEVINKPSLRGLGCDDNQIENLIIQDCPLLYDIGCNNNQLTELQLEGCSTLDWLECRNNGLTSLVLKGCKKLCHIFCSNNALTELDLRECPNLFSCDCDNNQLTEIKFCEIMKNLSSINCENNNLTSIDISGCPNLGTLLCQNNKLSTLRTINNPELWALECQNNLLTSLAVANNPELYYINIENNYLTDLDFTGCPNLRTLVCHNNKCSTLNTINNPYLYYLDCHDNMLTSLDITHNPELYYLNAENNSITELDISDCEELCKVYATEPESIGHYKIVIEDELGSYLMTKLLYFDETVNIIATHDVVMIEEQPEDISAEAGATVKFKVKASGTGLKYQWQVSKDGGNSWVNSGMTGYNTNELTVVAIKERNGYKFRCVVTDKENNKKISDVATLTVSASEVKITSQPANVTTASGTTVTFKITATGNGLKYQWQTSKNGGQTWVNSGMTGYNTDTLTVSAISDRNGYKFRCVVTDKNGNSVTSDAATLTISVSTDTKITSQPEDVTTAAGTTVTFKITASGTGLKYQWQTSKDGGSTWVNSGMTGYNTNTLTVSAIADRNGYKFRCVVTDKSGGSVTSDAATLTISASTDTKITSQPVDVTTADGTTVTFKITATGSGLKYQWQTSKNGGQTWVNSGMTGYNTNTLTVNANKDRNGYKFRCVVTDKSGGSVISDAATLTIGSGTTTEIKITSQPENVTTADGTTVTFKVTATGNGLKYQWQTSKNGGQTWVNSGMTGYNTNTLTVNANKDRNGYQFRCVVTDNAGNTATSNAATLTIGSGTTTEIKITSQPENVTTADGTTVSFKITATGNGLKYQWQTSKNGGQTWVNSGMTGYNTNTLTVNANKDRNGYQFRCVVTDNAGNTVTSNAATLTIGSGTTTEIKITSQPADVTTADGTTVTFKITATGNGLKYQWQTSKDGGKTWVNSGMTGYNTNTLTVSANKDRNGYQFRCIVTDSTGAKLTSSPAILTVTK
ncbi:MAG: leucine-rich repeat domain-containing protein [Lachnospiraceae bacterium]|nr:leucine-rich repeat domain-containing protein [Lachnospiraceae bacterium]